MTDTGMRATTAVPENIPPVIDLDDEAARRPNVTGAKAAAPAPARAAGLPLLPGFTVTTAGVRAVTDGAATRLHTAASHAA